MDDGDLSADEAATCILLSLEGSALQESLLWDDATKKSPQAILRGLKQAFALEVSVSQLMGAFYECRQRPGELFTQYSHALNGHMIRLVQCDSVKPSSSEKMLEDQFVNGLRDSHLRWELRKHTE